MPWPGFTGFSRHVLQRTGMRPLRFSGYVLRWWEDCAAPHWSWLRLAVYAAAPEGFAVEIRCAPCGPAARRPWCFAALQPDIGTALRALETAIPAPEAPMPQAGSDAALVRAAGARILAEAAQLRALRHATGEFLYFVGLGAAGDERGVAGGAAPLRAAHHFTFFSST